jgi:hypothetical protein
MSISKAHAMDAIYYNGKDKNHQRNDRPILQVVRSKFSANGVLNWNNSTLTFQINPQDNLQGMVLSIGGVSALAANQSYRVGFLFNAISLVKVCVAGSDWLSISGADLFTSAMLDCLNNDAKARLIALATPDANGNCQIPLSMLFSRFKAGDMKPKAFPFHLCNQGITLQITLQNVVYGTSASSWNANFTSANVICKHIIDKSVAPISLAPNEFYSYPTRLTTFLQFAVVGSTSSASPTTVQLNSFVAGKLKGLRLLAYDNATSGDTAVYTKGVQLKNLKLTQSGNILYDMENDTAQIFQLQEDTAPADWIDNTVALSPTTQYCYRLNLACMDYVNSNYEASGLNLASNFINLSATFPNTNNYTWIVIMDYQGHMIVHNGVVKFDYAIV